MNIEEVLAVAEKAIARPLDHTAANYWLLIRRGELLCVPSKCKHPEDKLVYLLTNHQLNHGLTSADWADLGNKLLKYYKELKL